MLIQHCALGSKVEQFLYQREGSTVLLSCGLGRGREGIEWHKDDMPLAPSHGGEVWLFHINHTHQGEYTCSYKQQRLSYYLFVQG